jgi:hypothetical protein
VEQREALAALRRAYERELPAKVEAIARALPGPQADGPDAASLDDLYHLAHRLAGSAAIYGFDDVKARRRRSRVSRDVRDRGPDPPQRPAARGAHGVVARSDSRFPLPSPDLDKRH